MRAKSAPEGCLSRVVESGRVPESCTARSPVRCVHSCRVPALHRSVPLVIVDDMAPLTALLLVAALALPGTTTGTTTDPVGVWPLQPEPAVVHGFDPPDSPYGPGHRGVDLLG